MTMRIALGLEYCGESLSGWQSQPDRRAAQDVLEHALAVIATAPVRTVAAGRTDAGVHATMQVVHFDTTAARPESAWVRGANSHLPSGMAVQWARPVAVEFHARFAATARHYTYVLTNRPVRPALLAHRVGWYHRPLDSTAMAMAARALVGTHDFSAFRASECQARSPVRTMTTASVTAEGEYLRFEFCANGFLHHMIRNVVGALVWIGAGKRPPDWLAELLSHRDRRLAAPTFAAAGLYFTGADYDPGWQLPATCRPLVLPLPQAA
jgi:tRNA pseudouridine38-40 synthase